MARSRYRRVSHTPQRPPFAAVALSYSAYILACGICLVTLYLAWPMLLARIAGAPFQQVLPTAAVGNVGHQAPPSARNTYQEPVAPAAVSTPIPGIAQNEADGLRIYQATAQASLSAQMAAATPVPAPLPLNSNGAPVIDQTQQQQLDQSAQMAADDASAAQRAQLLFDAQSRAPDVSKQDAEAELHRDLCHIPHADPATCDKGLYKPTPIGAP